MDNSPTPKIFISYSHDSPHHRDRVLALADRLRADGLDAVIDQYELAPEEGWPRWCQRQIEWADYVLVVCTETYHQRFQNDAEVRGGLGVRWEGAILTTILYDEAARNRRFVPVFFEPGDKGHIPVVLRPATHHNLSTEAGYDSLYRHLTQQPAVQRPALGTLRSLSPRPRQRMFQFPTGGDAVRHQNERHQALAEALGEAQLRRAELESRGEDTTEILTEILKLRRRLREGGQLQAGDYLLNHRLLLQDEIGQGGFATVWKAYDQKHRRIVAVKVLHGQFVQDRTRRERFARGARKMAELRHPGIVQILESPQEEDGYHFYVMEYVGGGDLQQAVLDDRLWLEERVQIILQIGEALSYAHGQGIVHRDLKPANILLDLNGRPKLTDFDLVHAFDTTGGTRTGMLGTVVYAAPEAMQQAGEVSPTADVYSLAMTAIFAFQAEEIALEILRAPQSLVMRLNLPLWVKGTLLQAIAWDVHERTRSVARFCADLNTGWSQTEATCPELPLLPEGERQRVVFPYFESSAPLGEEPEMPFRILILGDFRASGSAYFEPYSEDPLELEERPKVRINAGNFEQAMADFSATLELELPCRLTGSNQSTLQVNLPIETMSSFSPTTLLQQVPELAGRYDASGRIDESITLQINEILHHPHFQELESLWRSVKFLVDRCVDNQLVEIDLLNISKDELREDLEDVPDLIQSGLFTHLYANEYSCPGGIPVSVVIGAYELKNTDPDLSLMRNISKIATHCQAPFIASASPRLLHADALHEVLDLDSLDWAYICDLEEFAKYRSLRRCWESHHMALALPRFLVRHPHRMSEEGFVENIRSTEDILWGHASFLFAAVLVDSISRDGWCLNIQGPNSGGTVDGLPSPVLLPDGSSVGPLEVALPMAHAREFSNWGMISFCPGAASDSAFVFAACSMQEVDAKFSGPHKQMTAEDLNDVERFNSWFSTQLPYTFIMSRLMQCVLVWHREHGTPGARIEEDLENLLQRFTVGPQAPFADLAFELRAHSSFGIRANTLFEPAASSGEARELILHAEPRFRFNGLVPTLTMHALLLQ